MLKIVYFEPADYVGDAKSFQLIERLTRLCHERGLIVVHVVREAQLVISFARIFTPNDAYLGKKYYLADKDLAFNDPKTMLDNALRDCQPYIDWLNQQYTRT